MQSSTFFFFRYNEEQDRFRVPLPLPIFISLVYVYLALVPLINNPDWYFLYGFLLSLTSLVLYFAFVKFNVTLNCFDKVTKFCQMFFRVAVPDKDL